MDKRIFIFLAAALMCCVQCSSVDKKQGENEYDVFLLIGQSNMSGRGYMIEADTLSDIEGVYILNQEGEIVPARNPLNQYSTVGKSYSTQQISPGFSFSEKIYEQTGRKILLVVNARGGTNISSWAKGNDKTKYYSEAVRRAKQAMEHGELKAILWHQGGADSSDENIKKYMPKLSALVSDLRSDLGEDIFFVAGELGRWKIPRSTNFNAMMQGMTEQIPNTALVSSEDCVSRADDSDPHFDRDSQIIMGQRYADKVLEKIYKK